MIRGVIGGVIGGVISGVTRARVQARVRVKGWDHQGACWSFLFGKGVQGRWGGAGVRRGVEERG